MKTLRHLKRLVFPVLVGIAVALGALGPGPALGAPGHGVAGGHPGAIDGHQGFDGHRAFNGHPGFDPRRHGRPFFGYRYPQPYYGYYYPPAYGYAPDAYWYYCQSYGDYYPNVESCPEAWIPVPAS